MAPDVKLSLNRLCGVKAKYRYIFLPVWVGALDEGDFDSVAAAEGCRGLVDE